MNDRKAVEQAGFKTGDTSASAVAARAAKLEQLQTLLPGLVNGDGLLDTTVLREALGVASYTPSLQGYGLNFAGKGLARIKADEPTAKELRVEQGQSKNFKATQNIIIRGDNLDAMKVLRQNYAGKVKMIYIDPPYNSRQYSRFYHVLETLTKWDKPVLHGVALKPAPENMSDYCRVGAGAKFAELVADVQAKFLVVSYNNTYDSKSNSSRNRITLQDIESVLSQRGKTQVFEKSHRHFNAGNTDFLDHKEYLFVTGVES